MSKGRRIVLFLISTGLLATVFLVLDGRVLPEDQPSTVLFTTLLMMSFVTLFLEHFFTTPSDVLASSIAILLLLAPMRHHLTRFGIWFDVLFGYTLLMLLAALVALLLLDDTRPSASFRNKLSSHLKRFATFFGNGRWLFGALFFLTLVFYVDSQSPKFLVLGAFAAGIMLVDPRRFLLGTIRSARSRGQDIGEIIGVQSRNTFIARLFPQHPAVRRYDLVEFRYSMDADRGIFKGVIIDNYLLNEQQWIKILSSDSIRRALGSEPENPVRQTNVVYRIPGDGPAPEFLSRFVGVVTENSNIQQIRFDYGSRVRLAEGDLVELDVQDATVLYQVVQGMTEIEHLESRNEAGFIVGEAVQLGTWDPDRVTFEKFGWVPDVNTPVLLAQAVASAPVPTGFVRVGTIPGTEYPALMNLTDAISHHLAILGTTGCGKSVFARDLIRKIAGADTKVICVDFTNEYSTKLHDLEPVPVVPTEREVELFQAIDRLDVELAEFKNRQNRDLIAELDTQIRETLTSAVRAFMASNSSLGLFELPDVENTTGILEYTKRFFQAVFQIARREANLGRKVCVVLEEAHTVIPEWNFIGVDEKKAQSLVNSIGQIALQGRKYGVGFVVIAQRTANVSKTVLTQCNSVVAFQQFDKTSGDFLAHYMGSAMVEALPALRFRHAVMVGKGFASGAPMIVEVPVIAEPN